VRDKVAGGNGAKSAGRNSGGHPPVEPGLEEQVQAQGGATILWKEKEGVVAQKYTKKCDEKVQGGATGVQKRSRSGNRNSKTQKQKPGSGSVWA